MSEACAICSGCGHDEATCPQLEEGAPDDEREIEEELERSLEAEIERATERALENALTRRGGKRSKGRGLPEVKITSALADAIDEAEEAMRADKDVYERDHKLVRLLRPNATGQTAHLHLIELPTLRERLTNVAEFKKFDGRAKDYVKCLPSDSLVSGLLHRARWPRLRSLVGISETPFMRPDGTICQIPGYDEATGYEFIPGHGCKFDAAPEHPTQADARRAYERVAFELYGDFMFPEEQRSIPIAAILTLLARPAIDGPVPTFLFDGNVPGVGKTLVTDVIAMLFTGRSMPRMDYPPAEEEQSKMLAAYALAGVPFLSLDNIAAPFGGAPLDKVATARGTVQMRILGRTEMVTMTWYAVMFGTGNNLELRGDMAPRVLIARQESKLEDPRTRTGFRHPDLLAWVRSNRGWLVPELLTILRAYVLAGRPKPARWGSFEEWAALIPSALVYAGAPDPMSGRVRDPVAASDEHRQLVVVLQMWPKLVGELTRRDREEWERQQKSPDKPLFGKPAPKVRWGLSASDALSALYDERAEARASQFNPLREGIEALCCPKRSSGDIRPTAVVLGHKLRAFKLRVVSGRRLNSISNSHTRIDTWTVEDAQTGESIIEIKDQPIAPPEDAPVISLSGKKPPAKE